MLYYKLRWALWTKWTEWMGIRARARSRKEIKQVNINKRHKINRKVSIQAAVVTGLLGGWLLVFCSAVLADQPGRNEYLYALKLYEEKYYDLAAEQLERCLRDFPSLGEADEAQFLLGEAYLKSGDADRARAAYLRTAIVYPTSLRAPEALFKVGESLQTTGRLLDAAQAYERVEGFYSGSAYAPIALQRSAALYAGAGEVIRADEVVNRLIEKYPASPAASMARLEKAAALFARGDYSSALHYTRWVAERSGMDSLSARAWLQLGRFYYERFDFESAVEAFKRCIDGFPREPLAAQARLELADLYNFRGLTEQAVEVVAPLVMSSDFSVRIAAVERLGDANYQRREFERAIDFYDTAAAYSRRAALKAAWLSELLGHKNSAYARYVKIAGGIDDAASAALVRAAILALELNLPDKSAAYWLEIARNIESVPNSDRILYELAKARLNAGQNGVDAAVDTLIKRWPESPYADDALLVASEDAIRRKKFDKAVTRLEELQKRFPASERLETAQKTLNFLHAYHLRGDRLIERMAELSSVPQNRANPVKWALDWGDFYLDLFKDPVKAIDQYDRAMDDLAATTDDRLYALYRGGAAYILLAEAAVYENDQFSLEMYSDSAQARLIRLNRLNPQSEQVRDLTARWLMFRYSIINGDSLHLSNICHQAEALIARFNIEKLHPQVIHIYLESMRRLEQVNESNIQKLISLAEGTIAVSTDDNLRSRLKLWEARVLSQTGRATAARDTLHSLIQAYSRTPTAPEAYEILMHNKMLTALERYDYATIIRRQYPYNIEPVEFPLVEAAILDELGKPLEALTLREQSDAMAAWGQPRIKQFEFPNPESRLERASAYKRAGEYVKAVEELRIALNIDPQTPRAPYIYLELADIERSRHNYRNALNLIDSLLTRCPRAPETVAAVKMKPELYFSLGNYIDAMNNLNQQISSVRDRDSLFQLNMKSIVCLYRLDRTEEAKRTGNDLLKQFKEHKELEQARALFTLERGRALLKSKKWDEAREAFKYVVDKHPLTQWADDAAFAIGTSYLEQGRNDDAAKAFSEMISDYPDSVLVLDAYLMSGTALYRAEKYSESIAALRRVWENRKAGRLWQPTYEALLTLYRELRFWDAALRTTREYLERFPEAPDALDRKMDIANFYLELRDFDEAIRHYKPLLPLADAEREAEIQYYIGEAYMGKGDYRTAILEYLKVKVLGRKTKLDWGVTAIYQAGNCYEKLQDWEGAARMYRRIIQDMGEASNYGRAAKQKLDNLPRADAAPTP